MLDKIIVKGTQNFMGVTIPVMCGGFGKNCKIVTAKSISEIHNTKLREINQSIKRLVTRQRFTEMIDYIDLFSNENLKNTASDLGLITGNGQKQCFILSERGYQKLIKYMNDDKSWDVMEQFVEEYFRMRERLESPEQPMFAQGEAANLIAYMQEQEQKRFDAMIAVMQTIDSSLRSLVKMQLLQRQDKISISEMLGNNKSKYSESGKVYRDNVINLCKQIVALTSFADEKAVLSACYRHMTKNYGVVWEQEIKEWKDTHSYDGHVSPLHMVSESDENKFLKTMLVNILSQMLDECKQSVEMGQPDSEEGHKKYEVDYVATNFLDACDVVTVIADKRNDKSPYACATFTKVYRLMEQNATSPINWYGYIYSYKQRNHLPKSSKPSKREVIGSSKKLSSLFVQVVNQILTENLMCEDCD